MLTSPIRKMTIMKELKIENQWIRCCNNMVNQLNNQATKTLTWKKEASKYLSCHAHEKSSISNGRKQDSANQ